MRERGAESRVAWCEPAGGVESVGGGVERGIACHSPCVGVEDGVGAEMVVAVGVVFGEDVGEACGCVNNWQYFHIRTATELILRG